jgi:Domain of unknown function (DUF222)
MDVREDQHRLACLPLERLEAEITTLAGHLAAAECRWLLMVAEFDRRKGYEQWGCWCTSQWLGWKCGLEQRAAREKVRVALALDDLPAIAEAFAKGELSYSQVRALTRVAEPSTDSQLLAIARHATAAQLERLVRSYRGVLRREDETAAVRFRHDRRYVSFHWDDDGSLVLNARLAPEEGAVVLAALQAAEDSAGGSAEPPEDDPVTRTADRPAAARKADAFVTMAERSLTGDPTSRADDRYQVVIHTDAPALSDDAYGRCELANGPALAPETARRLACDGALVSMVDGPDGRPLDVGRKTRRIPIRLRRAVLARDGVCVFPSCDRPIAEIHHRQHWTKGGCTDVDNLDGLCKFHHWLVHEGGWSMERDDTGRMIFRRPDGTILETTPVRTEPADGRIEALSQSSGLTIAADTCTPACYGDALDLDWTVAGLCEHRNRVGAN